MKNASRVAPALSLVARGGDRARVDDPRPRRRVAQQSPAGEPGGAFALPVAPMPTLAECFAANGDAGWCGLLLPQLPPDRPWLWVQDRMAILENGRVHPPGLGAGAAGLIHVAARDARDALWAMEEGLRCTALGAVIGEVYGDPAALDFTATRRLAVASERHGVPAYLLRWNGKANLSGARWRWRVASAPSLANPLNPRAPGAPAWDAELFRARGAAPGRWVVGHEPGGGPQGHFHLVAEAGDRTLAPVERRRA